MSWRDHNGIQHQGSPPEGRVQMGGRWYALRQSLASVQPIARNDRFRSRSFRAVA